MINNNMDNILVNHGMYLMLNGVMLYYCILLNIVIYIYIYIIFSVDTLAAGCEIKQVIVTQTLHISVCLLDLI